MTAAAPPRTARATLCIGLAPSLLAAALSWRQIEAQDLGYHLADLAPAERALRTALGLRPDAASVQQNLALVQQALARAAGR